MRPGATLTAWEQFQSGTQAAAPAEILRSWQRSRINGVDPDRLELTHTEIDEESPFIRIGARVMEKMVEPLVGNSTSLALADANGTVTWRWDSERTVARALDHIDFGPGTRVSEPSAGTNGIGIATTTNRTALVVGPEHFKQPWHSWACAAAPVVDPISRRITGYINVACRAGDANELLLVAVRALVSGVETALGEAATARQRRMLDAHLSMVSTTTSAVITVDQHTMIVSDAASDLRLDRASLWSAVTGAGAKASYVALTERLHARLYPVSPGQVGDGVVLVIGAGVPRGLSPQKPAAALRLTLLEDAERRVIVTTLANCQGNKKEAALRLGLSRGTLYDRLRRYQIN